MFKRQAWGETGRNRQLKPNPKHSQTMIPFTQQPPYSVSGCSCCRDARSQQKSWGWNWFGTGHERQRGGGATNSNRVVCLPFTPA